MVHLVSQDLSIAGKRKGLAGERSGLFMEQIRIIKEMREHDRKTGRTGEFVRPRYMVWENVVGAQSSQQGRDFAAVLEEAIRVAEPEAPDSEWALLDTDSLQSVVASNIQRSFRMVQQREREQTKLPQEVQALLQSIRMGSAGNLEGENDVKKIS